MDFIYLVVIVVLVVLLLKKNPGDKDKLYSKGYWDGYSALGGKVAALLDAPKIDKDALQAVINDSSVDDESPEQQAEQVVVEKPKDPTALSQRNPAQPHRNLNIMLYLASFLFVSAGAAFISTEMPDLVKLTGVWLITLAFYIVGLMLHKAVVHLRPAAVAFTGTGLALIPFAGLALYSFGGVDGSAAWLLSSLIGVVLYFIAALRLQNSVVSYLTMAFVLSLVSSSVETLSMPILWQFVGLIGVALLASIVAFLKPTWLPSVFRDPIEKTGQYVTPVALGASVLVPHQVTLVGYEIIFGVAAAHYLTAWLQRREILYENAARAVLHIWILFIAWDVTAGDMTGFGLLFLSLAMFQVVYSLFVWPRPQEIAWMVGAFLLQFFSISFWSTHENWAILSSASFAVLATSGLIATAVTKKSYLIIPFIFGTIILPFTMRQTVSPALDVTWVALWLVACAVSALALYRWVQSAQPFRITILASFVSYGAMAFVMSMTLASSMATLILVIVALLCGIASYLFKTPWLMAGTVIVGWVGLMRLLLDSGGDPGWLIMASVWLVAGMTYLASWLMFQNGDLKRQQVFLLTAWFIAGCGIAAYFSDPVLKVAAAWTLVAVAITVATEGYRRSNKIVVEAAIYVGTFGLQYLLALAIPDISLVIYAHWWAAVIAGVAMWRQQWLPRLAIAMGIITYATAGYALSYGEGYALLFLVEHVALVALGVHLNRDWVIWWGIIASAVAVLYFLRDIAFLAFAFLGLLLIGLAIWRLGRMSKK